MFEENQNNNIVKAIALASRETFFIQNCTTNSILSHIKAAAFVLCIFKRKFKDFELLK